MDPQGNGENDFGADAGELDGGKVGEVEAGISKAFLTTYDPVRNRLLRLPRTGQEVPRGNRRGRPRLLLPRLIS